MQAKVSAQVLETDPYEQLKQALGPGWLPGLMQATGLSANGLKSMLRSLDTEHPKWVHVTQWLEARKAAKERAEAVLAEVVKVAA